ncbi:MAG TPA: hypothetical protein VGF67_32760 [Ktedonobacteraceae bacterium]|jgi:hypothetical protein
MQNPGKKIVLVVVLGSAGLLAVLSLSQMLFLPLRLPYWPLFPGALALTPVLAGGAAGAWVRGGLHLWHSVGLRGVLVWWGLLVLSGSGYLFWYVAQLPPTHPSGVSGPQPGLGDAIFLLSFICSGACYAVASFPCVLLGTALTYRR